MKSLLFLIGLFIVVVSAWGLHNPWLVLDVSPQGNLFICLIGYVAGLAVMIFDVVLSFKTTKYKNQISQLRTRNTLISFDLSDKIEQNANLLVQIDDMKKVASQLQNRINDLDNKLRIKQEIIDNNKIVINDLLAKIHELETKLSGLDFDLTEANKELFSRRGNMAQMSKKIKELRAAL